MGRRHESLPSGGPRSGATRGAAMTGRGSASLKPTRMHPAP